MTRRASYVNFLSNKKDIKNIQTICIRKKFKYSYKSVGWTGEIVFERKVKYSHSMMKF